VPSPCAFDDFAHMRELRYPTKFLTNLVAARNKHGGIAGPGRPNLRADRSTRYLARGIDDLLDSESFTRSSTCVCQLARPNIGIFRGLLEDIRRFAEHRTDFTCMQTSTKGAEASKGGLSIKRSNRKECSA